MRKLHSNLNFLDLKLLVKITGLAFCHDKIQNLFPLGKLFKFLAYANVIDQDKQFCHHEILARQKEHMEKDNAPVNRNFLCGTFKTTLNGFTFFSNKDAGWIVSSSPCNFYSVISWVIIQHP